MTKLREHPHIHTLKELTKQMEYLIKDRYPKAMFKAFEDICAIPHGSGNEAGIADLLVDFAKERSLEYYRDALGNVLIRKDASADKRLSSPVMLQAHTDMVCEKLPGSEHDPLRDPLKLKLSGDTLSADGTTLGADNGIGVAAMLAVLDDDTISHPELECLFTVSEETGMDGALGFDHTRIKSRLLINLDNTEEGNACCGCAGGADVDVTVPLEHIPALSKKVTLTVSGLAGGHSGQDIDLGRQNAIKLLSLALLALYERMPFCLISLSGGAKPNVIPSSAQATLSFFDGADAKKANALLKEHLASVRSRLCRDDSGFKYSFKTCTNAFDAAIPEETAALSYRSTHLLLSYIANAPSGVLKYAPDDRSRVLSSVNLGKLTADVKECRAIFFARSDDEAEIDETVIALGGLTRLVGGASSVTSRTPGWKFKKGGKLKDTFDNVCRQVLGRPAVIESIHAGLECGAIISALNAIDGAERAEAISIGATLCNIHSVKESVSLPSCERLYKIISGILAEL